mmetsp:Transcript_3993/g.14879  ORF Transcript_3993/g.14879 Transcript_3993/m.14879 type:complete len:211 (+) Transcript_3993:83-715(+)
MRSHGHAARVATVRALASLSEVVLGPDDVGERRHDHRGDHDNKGNHDLLREGDGRDEVQDRVGRLVIHRGVAAHRLQLVRVGILHGEQKTRQQRVPGRQLFLEGFDVLLGEFPRQFLRNIHGLRRQWQPGGHCRAEQGCGRGPRWLPLNGGAGGTDEGVAGGERDGNDDQERRGQRSRASRPRCHGAFGAALANLRCLGRWGEGKVLQKP